MSPLHWIACGALAAGLSACATFPASPYSPDYEALDRLKERHPAAVQVAAFEPTDLSAPVNRITLRGATLGVAGGSFAEYLRHALIRDLQEIGAYAPSSALRLDATLLKNDIDVSGLAIGRGVIEVELRLQHAGQPRLQKRYRADTEFESSFAAAVAVPKGQAEYANLVRALLRQIYDDPAFVAALHP